MSADAPSPPPRVAYAADASDPSAPGLDPNDPTLSPIEAQAAAFYVPASIAYQRPEEPEVPVVANEAPRSIHEVNGAVRWIGSWRQRFDGTAIVTRRYANALHAAGIPVWMPPCGSFTRWAVDPWVMAEVEPLFELQPRTTPLYVHHIIPTEASLRNALYPNGSLEHGKAAAEELHHRRILLSVWEQTPSASWANGISAYYLRQFAHHIVPCAHNRDVLLLAGVAPEKISVIHHPFSMDDARAIDAHGLRRPRATSEPYRFYTIGKWEPRKDQIGVIRAFLAAVFDDSRNLTPRPHLTVVTSPWWDSPDYVSPDKVLAFVANEMSVPEALVRSLVTIDLGRHQSMIDVHLAHDCFITASHGEAWGLPAHDAVLVGNPVIAPTYAGLAEFVEDEGVPYKLGPVPKEYAFPFKGGAKAEWAHVDEHALEERIAQAYRERTPRRPYSDANYDKQNPATVGKQLRQVIETVLGPGYRWR